MVNVSVVLYHTPEDELSRLIETCGHISGLHRLYIVDNSVNPNSKFQIPNSKSGVEYIFNGANLGYGRAHNIALRKSIADGVDYHLVVNADVEFSADVISAMVGYMESHKDVALLSPKVYYPDGEIQRLCKLLPTPMDLFGRRFLPKSWVGKRQAEYELHASGYNKIMNLPYLSGCFMFLRVECLKDAGLFDERYFMYPEDIDLTRRLHVKYKTLFYPEVSVIHHHERSSYKSLRMMRVHIVNMFRYFNKWGWFYDPERKAFNQRVRDLYLNT